MDAAKLRHLSAAMNFWEGYGFEPVDVPWRVPHHIIRSTLPFAVDGVLDKRDIYMSGRDHLCLVGSAEQSFVEMLSTGALEQIDRDSMQVYKGRYCAFSPCFRDEEEDHFHQKEFAKVELFSTIDTMPEAVDKIAKMNAAIMTDIARRSGFEVTVDIQPTVEGTDLLINGVEVGSYGVREWRDFRWFYGTALAEPRFTKALLTQPS